ncbi:unnamed protein product [Boreogadus saida]
MRRIREPSYWWILSFTFLTLSKHTECHPVALDGQPYHGGLGGYEHGDVRRERRAAGEAYWAYSSESLFTPRWDSSRT